MLDAWLVDFLDVDFAVVPPGFEIDLLTVFAGVLLVARVETLLDRLAVLRPEVPLEAIASISGAGFCLGLAARTCLMALVCCSRVILNSWWPSALATKYR